jgi:hypothetical protein
MIVYQFTQSQKSLSFVDLPYITLVYFNLAFDHPSIHSIFLK